MLAGFAAPLMFQHTAARRRLHRQRRATLGDAEFQHTAARRRLPPSLCTSSAVLPVSTHSRPKAAASVYEYFMSEPMFQHTAARRRLLMMDTSCEVICVCFNTQPPEGGCLNGKIHVGLSHCFNTQPPEGGCAGYRAELDLSNCFNTQPPEGGCQMLSSYAEYDVPFQHTAARRRLPGG